MAMSHSFGNTNKSSGSRLRLVTSFLLTRSRIGYVMSSIGIIPIVMVNMTIISWVGKANSSFKLNYVGLLVWKFMNNNNCWLLPGSLQEGKNPENVHIFNGYVAFLRQHNQELWDKVTTSHIIPSDKIKNWVSNVKHRYGTYGTFNDASDTMSGLYIGQHKLLDQIGFPFAH